MALTSKLGTPDSLLGNIQLAGGASVSNNQFPSNSLNLSHSVTINKVLNLSVSSTLTITDDERAFQAKKYASNVFVPSQTVVSNFVISRALTSSMTYFSVALVDRVLTSGNTIVFSDSATAERLKWTVNDFVISQTLSYNQIHIELPFNVFVMSQTVIVAAVRSYTTSDTITFDHEVAVQRVRYFNLAQQLFYNQVVSTVTVLGSSNTIAFAQAVVVNKVITSALTSNIVFAQDVKINAVYNRSFNDTLTFLNSHNRSSGLSGGSGSVITVPDVIVTKVIAQVIFQTPQRALTLKSPEFGDSEAGTSTIVTHRTITGGAYTYARRSISRILKYRFFIGRPKAEETRRFVRDFMSTPMYLTNWKGELWYGNIVNNPFQIGSKSRRMPCDEEELEITVEFEGVRVH